MSTWSRSAAQHSSGDGVVFVTVPTLPQPSPLLQTIDDWILVYLSVQWHHRSNCYTNFFIFSCLRWWCNRFIHSNVYHGLIRGLVHSCNEPILYRLESCSKPQTSINYLIRLFEKTNLHLKLYDTVWKVLYYPS